MSESKKEKDKAKKRRELDRKRDQGLKQATLFYSAEQLTLLDKVKVELGAKSRSEAMRWILSEFNDDLSAMVSGSLSTEQKASHG